MAVGFEINKQPYLALKYEDKCVIGAFHCTFFQRVTFIYKAMTRIEGYSIYKKDWLRILNMIPEIARPMR